MTKPPRIRKRDSAEKLPARSGPAVPAKTQRKTAPLATGTKDSNLDKRLRWQIVDSLWLTPGLPFEEKEKHVKAAMAMLAGIKPADEMEGMLATQMVATHSAAMECFRRAMLPSESVEDRAKNLRDAARLTSIYLRQIEVLGKHRGKGQQKVIVEHVNVHSGGQAIVGNLETGGRGKPAEGNGAAEPAPIENPARIKDDSGDKKPGRRRKS